MKGDGTAAIVIVVIMIAAAAIWYSTIGDEEMENVKTSNSEFKVSKLFEYEGCHAVRFYDGRWIYGFVCPGGSSSASFAHGKTTDTVVQGSKL
jgi:hypothetical protein